MTTVELTKEEIADLSVFHAIAYDIHRTECQQMDEIPACWLVVCPESRKDILEKAAVFLTGALQPIVPFTVEIAEKVANRDLGHILGNKLDLWRQAELMKKRGRAAHEVTAWFAK